MGERIGLVLEGGGFRGLYSEGVIETLLEKGIHLPYVVGVSMGAVVGSCYIAGQKRRNYDIAMTYIDDSRYLSYRNMLTQGGIFGMDFVFQDLAYDLIPFNFDAFEESDQELVIGAMRCDNGATDYFSKSQMGTTELMMGMRASCSLPFISKMVDVKGTKYLDGGVSDAIPFKKAFEDGCDKIIVILTREAAYERKAFSNHRLGAVVYRDYPAVVKVMAQRHKVYRESLETLTELEQQGKALVIRPPKPIDLGRMEKDRAKLRATYMMGYNQGKEMAETINTFINGSKISNGVVAPTYETASLKDVAITQPLWESLNEIHGRLSPDFGGMYSQVTFEQRVGKFRMCDEGDIRIRVVKDQGEVVGYCISTVNRTSKIGDLESLFLRLPYRNMGVGKCLVEDSKQWMCAQGSKRLVLGVTVGNEGVLPFYEKLGFYPKLIELEYCSDKGH